MFAFLHQYQTRPRTPEETAADLQYALSTICPACSTKNGCEKKTQLESGQTLATPIQGAILCALDRLLCGKLCPYAAERVFREDSASNNNRCSPLGPTNDLVFKQKPLEGQIEALPVPRPDYCRYQRV